MKSRDEQFSPDEAARRRDEVICRVDRFTLDRLHEAMTVAEKALGAGEDILSNFARVRTALNEKKSA